MPLIVWSRTSLMRRGLPLAAVFVVASAVLPILQTPAYFVAGAALAHTEVRNRVLEGRLAQWLGRISYSLYLSHALVLATAVKALGPAGGVWALPAVFAVGWLVWRTVERPSLELSRQSDKAVAWAVERLGRPPGMVAP